MPILEPDGHFLLVIAYFRKELPAGSSMKGLKVITRIIHFIDLITVFSTVKEIKYKWLTAFSITLFLFLLVNIFLFPLFNSGDDVFLMYTLAGGYGETPTNLLHYNHIWHPLLGWIVKSLFLIFPTINWYTISLLLFHWFGWTVILFAVLKNFQWKTSLVLFSCVFFFYGIQMLLSLTFTSAAWILAAGGFLLLTNTVNAGSKKVDYIFVLLLLLIAGLLRLHVLVLQTILFIPVFLIYQRKNYKKWGSVLVIVLAIISLFNIQHQHFYKKNIPDWEKQEAVRQSLFFAFNRPLQTKDSIRNVFHDSVEKAFYFRQFFFDTNFISTDRIKKIGHALIRKRDFKDDDDANGLYWFFMGFRVYILLFSVCFFIVWCQKILFVTFRRWILSSICVFGVYGYLFFFLKFTEPIYLGLGLLLFLYFILALSGKSAALEMNRRKAMFPLLLLVLPFTWMGIQLLKKNNANRKNNESFNCFISEIQEHADKLFIATDDNAPFSFFYIWGTPYRYKVRNIIHKDRILTYTYYNTLQRFGIGDITTSIYENKNVLLLGNGFSELENYYHRIKTINVSVSRKLPGYDCLQVRKAYKNDMKD